MEAHAAVAALHLPQKTLDAVLDDWTTADIPEHTRAALRLLECMTLRPLELVPDFVERLKRDGLDDPSIREAANVGFHYNLINRVADAFDFPVPRGVQRARLAKMLDISGKLLKGGYAETVWVRSGDGAIRPTEVERGRQQLLTGEGVTSHKLRWAVEAYAVAQWEVSRQEEPAVPEELIPYLKKLSMHAYRITDEDVDALRDAGYSDEMIYEITMVGAFGTALIGLESLFGALYGEQSN